MSRRPAATWRVALLPWLAAVLAVVVGCQDTPTNRPAIATAVEPGQSGDVTGRAVGYTHLSPDGNRVVAGTGGLPDVAPIDISLDGVPVWLVTAPFGEGSIWVAVLDDGRVQAFRVSQGEAVEIAISPDVLPSGAPPLLVVENGAPRLVAPPDDASTLTHPVVLDDGRMVYIDGDGALVLVDDLGESSLAVGALPDARILVDENQRLLVLTGPTERYPHGVLGDRIEASAITLVETGPTLREVLTIPVPDVFVIEGISPIWADIDGVPGREIVVTFSNAQQGAQIVVFDESGNRVASGPAIGRASRWRHQIASGPFGPGGETELVDVLTPHIGGVVEFYRRQGEDLRIVAQVSGYTSHVIGTRNLDMAAAGDFDGDGRMELLLPSQSRTELGAIRRTQDGAEVAWTVSVGGRVVTNLAVVGLLDGTLAVGVGRDDGVLRLWLPEP